MSFLHCLYELTDADRNRTVSLEEIAKESHISIDDANSAGQYLHDEKLIGHPVFPTGRARTFAKYTGMVNAAELDSYRLNWNPKGRICITHRGIKEIEQALNKPNEATEHFQSVTINNYIHNSGVIANQNLQQATIKSSQSAFINSSKQEELQEIINQICELINEKKMTTEQSEMLEIEAKTLELQIKSTKPRIERIRESLSSAKGILETISAGAPIVAKILAWLNGLH